MTEGRPVAAAGQKLLAAVTDEERPKRGEEWRDPESSDEKRVEQSNRQS